MEEIQMKKRNNKELNIEDLRNLSKEDLIDKVITLHRHNTQLQNIISKSNETKAKKCLQKPQKPFNFDKCTFRHIIVKLLYLGWDYQGYATQEDSVNTIEHFLFAALTKACLIKDRSSSNYHRCGRTDKGVSSFGQVISIDVRSRLADNNWDDVDNEINYCGVLNRLLPDNLQCVAWCPAAKNYSARFNCKLRTYKYFFPKGNLNIEKMQCASNYLLGTHDYRNFCKMDVGNGVVKFVRNITDIQIVPYSKSGIINEYSMYVATIKGQAFLWHQIRCVMGVLFLVGEEKECPNIIKDLLDIDSNSRKPDYNMASEVPLNLFNCEYDSDIEWIYDWSAFDLVLKKLQTIWTFHSVKATMIENMTHDLCDIRNHNLKDSKNSRSLQNTCLLNGIKSKVYIPLLQRPKCESLENRIEHYIKRQKLEISEESPRTTAEEQT